MAFVLNLFKKLSRYRRFLLIMFAGVDLRGSGYVDFRKKEISLVVEKILFSIFDRRMTMLFVKTTAILLEKKYERQKETGC